APGAERGFEGLARLPLAPRELGFELRGSRRDAPLEVAHHSGAQNLERFPELGLALGLAQLHRVERGRLFERQAVDRRREFALPALEKLGRIVEHDMAILELRHRGLELGARGTELGVERRAALQLPLRELGLELRVAHADASLEIGGHAGAELLGGFADFRLAPRAHVFQALENGGLLGRKPFDRGGEVALALPQELDLIEQPGALVLETGNRGFELGALGAQSFFQGLAALPLAIGERGLELREARGPLALEIT